MTFPRKTAKKAPGANFEQTAPRARGVRVSPGKGGVNIGTPTECAAKRKAHSTRYH